MNIVLDNLSIVVQDNFLLMNDSKQAELLAKIKEFYFQNRPISRVCAAQFIEVSTHSVKLSADI